MAFEAMPRKILKINNNLTAIPDAFFEGRQVYKDKTLSQRYKSHKEKPNGVVFSSSTKKQTVLRKCCQKKCLNYLLWSDLREKNFSRFRLRCSACRTHEGITYVSPRIWAQRHLVAGYKNLKCGQKKLLMRCTVSECQEVTIRQLWQDYEEKCIRHGRPEKTMFGFILRSKKILAEKHLILNIRKRPDGRLDYLMKCRNVVCNQEVWRGATNFQKSSKCCNKCQSSLLRMPLSELAFASLKRRAKRAKMICTLTQIQFNDLSNVAICFYCNRKIIRRTWTELRDANTSAGYYIDRLDNTRGYHWNNCVACCTGCNKIKNAWKNSAEMLALKSFAGWESALLHFIRRLNPGKMRRLAAKHRRSGA